MSLSISLFLSTHTSQLSLNPVSTTFVPSATSGQFWVKTQPISSPALLSLPAWTMQMHACLASLSRIYLEYREFKTRLLVSSHASDLGSALPLCWNTSTGFQSQPAFTSKLPYLLSSHSTPYLHHIFHPSFVPMFLRAPSALPVLSVSVSHMSAPYSALGVLDRPVQQSGIPYHFQLLPAPPFILSRNSLRLICLPQPSPLVELSSMRLWFDDLHLFIYLVVFDFVRA